MTTNELKAKHHLVEWHSTNISTEKHTNISIEFAISVLVDILDNMDNTLDVKSYQPIHDKINQLKESLKK